MRGFLKTGCRFIVIDDYQKSVGAVREFTVPEPSREPEIRQTIPRRIMMILQIVSYIFRASLRLHLIVIPLLTCNAIFLARCVVLRLLLLRLPSASHMLLCQNLVSGFQCVVDVFPTFLISVFLDLTATSASSVQLLILKAG